MITTRSIVGRQSLWFEMFDRHLICQFLPRPIFKPAGALIRIYLGDFERAKTLVFILVPCLCHVSLQHEITHLKRTQIGLSSSCADVSVDLALV